MNKTALLLGVFFVIFLIPRVSASLVDLEVLDPVTDVEIGTATHPLELCPRPIIYPTDVRIFLTNLGAEPDTYVLSFEDLPEGWEGQIERIVMLDSGQKKELSLFLINLPYPWTVSPGTYYVTLRAQSNSDPNDFDLKQLKIEILSCYIVEISVEEAYKEMCLETPGSVTYPVEIKNLGKNAESLELEALYNGEKVDWAVLSEDAISLASEQSKTITLKLTPPADLKGIQTVKINAKTTLADSYAFDSKDVQLNIANCYDFDVSLDPPEHTKCIGTSAEFILTIDNLGMDDTYTISAPDWVELERTVSVPGGQQKEIPVTVTPTQKGTLQFELAVASANEPGALKTVSGTVNSQECRDVAVSISPAQITSCHGDTVTYTVTVKNRGTAADTFDLTTSLGVLEQTSVSLEPGETQDVTLTVETVREFDGPEIITVIASNEDAINESWAYLKVEDCYTASITITPGEVTVCPNVGVDYQAEVLNTGLPDTFTITYGDLTENVFLDSGQSHIFNFSQTAPAEPGDYDLVVLAESDRTSSQGVSKLTVKETGECYSVQLTNGELLEGEVYMASVAPVYIKNTGEVSDTYSLIVTGPNWTYIEPESVELGPGEEAEAYVYISPPHGTDPGDYSVRVDAVSPYASAYLQIPLKVELNETAPGVTLNVSLAPGGPAGMIIAPEGIAAWKVMAIGIIAVIIIAILGIRFIVLVR